MRVAIVGAGISGLAAASALDAACEVTIFESEARLGGHACTVDVDFYGPKLAVDCGFIVYNRKTYPGLTKLFRELGVQSKPTTMEFSVSLDESGFEWALSGLSGVFANRRNLFDPKVYSTICDILRFFRLATADVVNQRVGHLSLGEYLDLHRFGSGFRDRFLVPMCRSIWSSSVDEVFTYPAEAMLDFLHDHGLLSVRQPIWLTVTGGARTYVEKLRSALSAKVQVGTSIVRVRRSAGQVEVVDSSGQSTLFDHVILACHAPDALKILEAPSARVSDILGRFRYTRNAVVLHGDASFMPANSKAWSSWNYRGYTDPARSADPVELTYWMNRIQYIPAEYPLFVTLNPARPPKAELSFAAFTFDHPQFDRAALSAQKELCEIQGEGNIWFCGAYTRYGFHEDGLMSGSSTARALLDKMP